MRNFINPEIQTGSNAKIETEYTVKLKRSSAADMPSGAIGKITSNDGKAIVVSKPDEDSLSASQVLICPDFPIASSNYFYGSLLPNKPIPVYYDPSGGVPTVGGTVGTIADSWLVSAANTGFRVMWVDASLERVWVIPDGQKQNEWIPVGSYNLFPTEIETANFDAYNPIAYSDWVLSETTFSISQSTFKNFLIYGSAWLSPENYLDGDGISNSYAFIIQFGNSSDEVIAECYLPTLARGDDLAGASLLLNYNSIFPVYGLEESSDMVTQYRLKVLRSTSTYGGYSASISQYSGSAFYFYISTDGLTSGI